jgi:threonine dehydratase
MSKNLPGQAPQLIDIRQAATRLQGLAHRTPVLTSTSLDELCGSEVFFKCENMQKVGAFKFRGAVNAVLSLNNEEAKRGVATHSSGNHAQALSLAAKIRGIEAHIVMPSTSPKVKVAAVRGYGGRIVFCDPTQDARETTLKQVQEQTGAIFIHPYNNPKIIAGQGTCALELLEQVPNLEIIMAPVGGGGLLSGTALAVHYTQPDVKVIAGEPKGADDAYRSFISGILQPLIEPNTIADGLRTSLGSLTFPIIRQLVTEIITVSEEAIVSGMRFIWERIKILIEPSAAVPFAALLETTHLRHRKIGIILSGGNVDLDSLPWLAGDS